MTEWRYLHCKQCVQSWMEDRRRGARPKIEVRTDGRFVEVRCVHHDLTLFRRELAVPLWQEGEEPPCDSHDP